MSTRHALATTALPPLAQRLRGLARTVRSLVLLAVPILVAIPVLLLTKPEWLSQLGLSQVSGMELSHLAQGGVTLAARARLAAASLLVVGVGLGLLWQL